jgi:hypothetical protein
MFVGQPFHDFINSTHYNVFCPFTERNHTILIFMTHFILFKFGINEFKYHQICLLRATHYNLSYFIIDIYVDI